MAPLEPSARPLELTSAWRSTRISPGSATRESDDKGPRGLKERTEAPLPPLPTPRCSARRRCSRCLHRPAWQGGGRRRERQGERRALKTDSSSRWRQQNRIRPFRLEPGSASLPIPPLRPRPPPRALAKAQASLAPLGEYAFQWCFKSKKKPLVAMAKAVGSATGGSDLCVTCA